MDVYELVGSSNSFKKIKILLYNVQIEILVQNGRSTVDNTGFLFLLCCVGVSFTDCEKDEQSTTKRAILYSGSPSKKSNACRLHLHWGSPSKKSNAGWFHLHWGSPSKKSNAGQLHLQWGSTVAESDHFCHSSSFPFHFHFCSISFPFPFHYRSISIQFSVQVCVAANF